MTSDRSATQRQSGLRFLLRAFHLRNYRLYYVGQGISFIGTWMHRIAMSWLIYRLTGSEALLGAVVFASLMPAFAVSPFAGVLADRMDRRRLIIAANALAALQALGLAILTLMGVVAVWHIMFFSVFLGIAAGFEIPIRQAFVIDIVKRKENLGNAIALNSSLFNIARIIGPVLAGAVVHFTNEGVCFLVNSISFLAAIAAMVAMDLKPHAIGEHSAGILVRLREGFHYTVQSTLLRNIILYLAFLSLTVMPYFTLLTVFAKDVLRGEAHTLGFLAGATGIGSLIGAGALAHRRDAVGLERWIPVTTGLYGIAAAGFSLSGHFWLSLAIAPFCGFGLLVALAASNTLLQTYVDDDKRGRVMSFYSMSFMGMAPFGSLLSGLAAERIGAPRTLLISGIICAAAGLVLLSNLPYLARITEAHRSARDLADPVTPDVQTGVD
jgi:MFS family permease